MIQIFGMGKNKLDNYEIRKVLSQITGSKHNFLSNVNIRCFNKTNFFEQKQNVKITKKWFHTNKTVSKKVNMCLHPISWIDDMP